MNKSRSKILSFVLSGLAIHLVWINTQVFAQGWPGYAHDAQHSCVSSVPSQLPQAIRWSTPVDLNPQYSGNDLYIHYGTPVITAANTVILPVKTGATGGFRVDAHSASNGALLWTLATDYAVPAHNWFPIFGVTLTPNDAGVAVHGAGGTIYFHSSPNSASGATTQMAFYGIANYAANQAAYSAAIQICTPISSDGQGNLYFGYVSTGVALPGYANGIPSGLARISSGGVGTFASAAAICGDNSMRKVAYNCAPAFSSDGTILYVAVNNGSYGSGYLCALNSTTLARQSSVFLLDPRSTTGSPLAAVVTDDSSASPTVGPDGDVYYGVLEANLPSHNDRGWLLHFSGNLGTTKLPGSFGWDDTASVVPVSAVPSYSGPSSYLLLTKYNNYAGVGSGDGVNRLALVDPNTSSVDSITGTTVMNPFLTVKGVTPDPKYDQTYPNAVREWCINSAAIDLVNKCAAVNSEDGKVYRWDFTTNSLSPGLTLAPPTGEAYTPTVIGPDGAVYAINNATLFSVVGNPPSDFNGDGYPDYLLFNASTRQTAIWHLKGVAILTQSSGPTLPAGWAAVTAADFDGDGKADCLLYNAGTRQTAIWYMNDTVHVAGAYGPTLPVGWTVAGVADFNGDGEPDYLLFNASTRQTAIWYLNDAVLVGTAYGPTLPAGWTIGGVADFNGDGQPDFLLFNASTRQTAIWTLNNNLFVSALSGPTLPVGWAVSGAADFNGDGKPDYVLFNASTLQTAIWYMNGPMHTGGDYGPTLPASWRLVAP